jgi:hypothetical protein
MAKKKKTTEGDETVSNFQNLDALKKEFKTGKMPGQKLTALKKKLVGHFKDETITEEEQLFMKEILKKERLHKTITSAEKYILNSMESDECEGVSMCKSADIPSVLHLKKDLLCKFRFDEEYDDGKGKDDSIGRYHVYVPRTIPTRHQLSVGLVVREEKGHPTDPSEYPADKIVIHHVTLKVKEFEKWFEIQDPDILDKDSVEAQNEQAYQF